MSSRVRTRLTEETQVQPADRNHAHRFAHEELLVLVALAQKNGDTVDGQGSREPIDHRREKRVEVRFGAQLASELNQRAAIVVNGPVKEMIDAILNPFA